MILFFAIITLVYVFLMLMLIAEWNKIELFDCGENNHEKRVTIIIPVRDEANSIGYLLHDIDRQTYPQYLLDVIVIDDHSSDSTRAIVEAMQESLSYSLKIYDIPEGDAGPKKRAITLGVEKSEGDLIISTDGDCRVAENWVRSIVNYQEDNQLDMVLGPVSFADDKKYFTELQSVEFASLIGTGASSLGIGIPSMCNGANIAYLKSAFQKVNGFEGYENEVSGDDEFLMHKLFESDPAKVGFLKSSEAIVFTEAPPSISRFFAQRKRWASKWNRYVMWRTRIFAMLIFGIHLSYLAALILACAGLFSFKLFGWMLLVRVLLEYVFIAPISGFLGRKLNVVNFLIVGLGYSIYAVTFGLLGTFGGYKWKGRKYK